MIIWNYTIRKTGRDGYDYSETGIWRLCDVNVKYTTQYCSGVAYYFRGVIGVDGNGARGIGGLAPRRRPTEFILVVLNDKLGGELVPK